MKKTFAIFLSIIFAAIGVSAQQNKPAPDKAISDAEFKAVLKKSDDKTRGKSYRVKRSSKTYKRTDNSLSRSFTETIEYAASGESRSVTENASANEKPTLTETVKIGEKVFTRINGGGWQTNLTTGNTTQTRTNSGDSVEHIYKGTVNSDGKQASLYESKIVNKTIKGGRNFVTVTKIKNWFGTDGVLLRTEEEIETPNTLTRRVLEYEYDVDVKIEAPLSGN
jgi:hypothetical protein